MIFLQGGDDNQFWCRFQQVTRVRESNMQALNLTKSSPQATIMTFHFWTFFFGLLFRSVLLRFSDRGLVSQVNFEKHFLQNSANNENHI